MLEAEENSETGGAGARDAMRYPGAFERVLALLVGEQVVSAHVVFWDDSARLAFVDARGFSGSWDLGFYVGEAIRE